MLGCHRIVSYRIVSASREHVLLRRVQYASSRLKQGVELHHKLIVSPSSVALSMGVLLFHIQVTLQLTVCIVVR
jgi:hypothetical protein